MDVVEKIKHLNPIHHMPLVKLDTMASLMEGEIEKPEMEMP